MNFISVTQPKKTHPDGTCRQTEKAVIGIQSPKTEKKVHEPSYCGTNNQNLKCEIKNVMQIGSECESERLI
jgi:hypothetical protein